MKQMENRKHFSISVGVVLEGKLTGYGGGYGHLNGYQLAFTIDRVDSARGLDNNGFQRRALSSEDRKRIEQYEGIAAAQTSTRESPQEKQDLAPELVSPAEGAELDNNCKDYSDMIFWGFRWGSVPGATQYHLYVRGSKARFPVIDESKIKTNVYFRRSRIDVIVPGNCNGWHWKVRAKVNRKWGPWSESRSFYVESWDLDCGKKRERIPR